MTTDTVIFIVAALTILVLAGIVVVRAIQH
jgi:hypothetical protein